MSKLRVRNYSNSFAPFSAATRTKFPELVRKYLDDSYEKGDYGAALWDAVTHGHLEIAKLLRNDGAQSSFDDTEERVFEIPPQHHVFRKGS